MALPVQQCRMARCSPDHECGAPPTKRMQPAVLLPSVITLGLAFLLGLTIYAGLRWQLQSLAGYFAAVSHCFSAPWPASCWLS